MMEADEADEEGILLNTTTLHHKALIKLIKSINLVVYSFSGLLNDMS